MKDTDWLGLAAEAAARWSLQVEHIELAARCENLVFRITTGAGSLFALRVHWSGYRSADELASELTWMQVLAQGGLAVPTPLASRSRDLLEAVHGQHVSVLSWLSGTQLDYPSLTAALCEGYRSLRPLDTTQLDLFLMLRAFTYIGWIVPRLGGQGSDERSECFLTTGIELAETWLSSR
jgi:Ser/Thr protein kinase RdoA (MazF antagonist)